MNVDNKEVIKSLVIPYIVGGIGESYINEIQEFIDDRVGVDKHLQDYLIAKGIPIDEWYFNN